MTDAEEQTVAFEIVDSDTDEVVKRIDCRGKSDTQIERAFGGLLLKVNFDKYFVREVKE